MNDSYNIAIESAANNLSYEENVNIINLLRILKSKIKLRNTIITTMYGLIIVISLLGNLLVFTTCIRKFTKINALILSLSSSDLLMTVFNIPLNVVRIVKVEWPFGPLLCFSVPFVQAVNNYKSIVL